MYFLNFLNQFFIEKITEYKVLDIIIKLVMGFLMLIVILGLGKLIFELITNSSSFDNTQFGIFDYI
jgi:hypothetical protein